MAIRIVTDSASDILPEEGLKLGIEIIPLTLTWDNKEYRDGLDLDHETFFTRLESVDTVPTTSQIPPIVFEQVFDRLTSDGDEVIAITLSSKLSGTYQSANIAASEFEGKVKVVDSLSATVGEKLLVLNALDYINQGMNSDEIVSKLTEDRGQLRVLAMLDTLEYLKKGGRISSAVALAGGLLSIKPVIKIEDGAISLIGKARGSKNGNNLLRKFVDEVGGIDFQRRFILIYSGNNDELLKQYIQDSKDMWQGQTEDLPISTIGAVIGTHIGPGAIGIIFFSK